MADSLSFEIKGLEAIDAKLKAVKGEPRKKSFRFALRKAANIVHGNVKARAERLDDPKTSTHIAENVVVRYDGQHFKQTGDLKMSVGIRGGSTSKARNASNPGGDTYYWRFLEFGTEKMRAQPFMRPGMEESTEPAIDEFVKHADRALARAIKRANRGK